MDLSNFPPDVKQFVDSDYVFGADIGQQNDPTALAVLERRVHSLVSIKGRVLRTWNEYLVRHLERLPLGTSYPSQIQYMKVLHARPPLNGTCPFLGDQTGVGAAVLDIAAEAGLRPNRIVITGGDSIGVRGNDTWSVAKSVLISMIDAKLHTGELKIAADLAEAPALREELRDFRRHVSASGRFTYEARATKHDDIVLAISICLFWWLGRSTPPTAYVGRATYQPQ